MAHVTGQWDQDSFAWYTDAGGEGTNQIGSTNSNPTTLETETQYRLRYLIQETAGSTQAETPVLGLQYRVDPAGGTNFGAWTSVDSDDASFVLVSTANVTDGGATTQQIGAGTFRDGEFSYVDATALAPTTALTATAGNDEYEAEWVLSIANGAGNDTFEFRVVWNNGGTPDTALTTYTNTTQVSFAAGTNVLTADDLESAGQLSQPTAGHIHDLTADDLNSASNVSQPAVGQEHALTADDLNSAGELSTPAVGQKHALLADDLQALGEVTSPALVEDTQNELLADDLESAGELSSPLLAVDYDVLRPDGDVTITGWTDEGGATTSLFQSIDEDVADTADYIRSPLDPQGGTNLYQCSLTDYTGTVDTNLLQQVSYQIKKDSVNSSQQNLTVRLKEGVTTIATWTHTDVTAASWQIINQTLTAPQKAAITNYNDCRLEFEASEP